MSPRREGRWAGAPLRTRLAVLLGASAVVLVVAAGILFSSLSTLSTERHRVVNEIDPAVLAARDLRTAMVDQETAVRGYVLTRSSHFLTPYNEGITAALLAASELEPLVASSPTTAADFEAFQAAADRWQDEFASVAVSRTDNEQPELAQGAEFLEGGRVLFDSVRSTATQLEQDLRAQRDDAVEELNQSAGRVWAVAICIILGFVALGVVIVVALKRSVTDPIIELAGEVRAVADGDLARTVRITEASPEIEGLAADIDAMRRRILGEIDRLNQANEAIAQQSLELQRSNADLEQFAYVASHDLQEPLRKIAGFCQLLERRYRGQLDDRADEYIDFVVDGAKRMQDLINDLLAFSRVGRTTTRFAPVDLEASVGEAVDNLRAAIDESGAVVETANLPVVEGDRRLLAALMQNLIGNAIKFRGDEPPHVRVEAALVRPASSRIDGAIHLDDGSVLDPDEADPDAAASRTGSAPAVADDDPDDIEVDLDPDGASPATDGAAAADDAARPPIPAGAAPTGPCWLVSVADNGIGIESDYADQIFTIFQRLHARSEYEGTGIGLALAKKIVEFHGGTIWLDTDVTQGATFRFTVPAADRAGADGDGPPAPLTRPISFDPPSDGAGGATPADPTVRHPQETRP